MNTSGRLILSAIALCALSSNVLIALADEYDLKHFRGRQPSKADFIDALKLEESLKIGGSPKKGKIAIEINFEYKSYGLTPDAKSTLNQLGEALQDSELSQNRFRIEGHTDATGTEEYNRRLSERRAESVKHYLVDTLGIDSSRLQTVGRGEDELLDKANPTSGMNRRVQVVNLQ